MLFESFQVIRLVTLGEDACMHTRMECLHTAIEHLREVGHFADIFDRHPCVSNGLTSAASGDEFNTETMESLRQIDEAGFISYAQ